MAVIMITQRAEIHVTIDDLRAIRFYHVFSHRCAVGNIRRELFGFVPSFARAKEIEKNNVFQFDSSRDKKNL